MDEEASTSKDILEHERGFRASNNLAECSGSRGTAVYKNHSGIVIVPPPYDLNEDYIFPTLPPVGSVHVQLHIGLIGCTGNLNASFPCPVPFLEDVAFTPSLPSRDFCQGISFGVRDSRCDVSGTYNLNRTAHPSIKPMGTIENLLLRIGQPLHPCEKREIVIAL